MFPREILLSAARCSPWQPVQIIMILFSDCMSNSESCVTYHLPKSIPYTVCNIIILLFITILKFILSYFNKKYNRLSPKTQ